MFDHDSVTQHRLPDNVYCSSNDSTIRHPNTRKEGDKFICPDCGAVSRDQSILSEIECVFQIVPDRLMPTLLPKGPTLAIGQMWWEIGQKHPWVLVEDENDVGWKNLITGDLRIRRNQMLVIDCYDDAVVLLKSKSAIFDISNGDDNLRKALVDARTSILRDGLEKFITKEHFFRISPIRTDNLYQYGNRITIGVVTKAIPIPNY